MIKLDIIYRPKRAGLGKPEKVSTETKPTGVSAVTRKAERSGSATDTSQPCKFDKVAYQREYMRRYRAKKAGK